jgi:hypothetical protein
MTAAEVVNSSANVDAASGPLPTGRDQNLQIVLQRAQDQLRELMLQRQEIAERIAVIKRTIAGLALLYGHESQHTPEGANGERRRGVTDACRVVLKRADKPLTARAVYANLQEEFPQLFAKSGEYYASLVTILNRLAKYGEADTFLHDGSRFWRGRQSADHQSVGLSGT